MYFTTHSGISNEDIMSTIFMKLPAKSVLKCRCVCKIWQSIASNPLFCHQHASLHGPNLSPSAFIFKRSVDTEPYSFESFSLTTKYSDHNSSTSRIVSFDYLNVPGNETLSLLSSCNGLLLFQSSDYPRLREYYVCNPTTKKSLKLVLPSYLTARNLVDASLAFDPRVSPYYKVVFLWKGSDDRDCITMYSSETKNCGKVSLPSHSNYLKLLQGSGVYCNGKIHWLNYMSDTSFCFDVEEGCVKTFPLPPFTNPGTTLCRPFHYFGASQGRLHAVMCDYFGSDDTFVFELEEDYSRWILKYQLKFKTCCNLFLRYSCDEEEEEEEDEASTLLLLNHSGKVEVYNLKEKTRNKVCHLNRIFNNHHLCSKFYPIYQNHQWCPVAYPWIETLSCV